MAVATNCFLLLPALSDWRRVIHLIRHLVKISFVGILTIESEEYAAFGVCRADNLHIHLLFLNASPLRFELLRLWSLSSKPFGFLQFSILLPQLFELPHLLVLLYDSIYTLPFLVQRLGFLEFLILKSESL